MKLSEAIRLGAMLKPQAFGTYQTPEGSCAIGAACEAVGVICTDLGGVEEIPEMWRPLLYSPAGACPECGETRELDSPIQVGFVIADHLNDSHNWTREQIADWVETIERRAEAALVVAPAVSEAQKTRN